MLQVQKFHCADLLTDGISLHKTTRTYKGWTLHEDLSVSVQVFVDPKEEVNVQQADIDI